MRVLFSSMRMTGHIRPLLPYAHALRNRGHEVLFAAPEDAGAIIRDAGLDHAVFSHPGDKKLGEVSRHFATMSPGEATKTAVRTIFVELNARAALPGLRSTIQSWRPDLIVRESMEFGAAVAAAESGIPIARVASINSQGEARVLELATEPLDAIRQEAELNPDGGAALRAEPAFTSFPPSLDGNAMPATIEPPFRVCLVKESVVPDRLVPAWAVDDGRPLVFITFGTLAAGSESNHGLFRMALEAVGALPVRALFSTGRAMDMAALGAVPENVAVTSWVNQGDVFPRAAVLVCHGGAGTVLAGLNHGLPMIITPISADQPENARLVEATGAGIALLKPDAVSLRAAVERALVDPGLRAAAGRVAEEMANMPSVDDAVSRIERMSRG